jgi:hypothetical protein
MTKKIMMANGGIIAILEDSPFDANFSVREYNVALLKDDGFIGMSKNTGARFGDDTKELINKAVKGNKVIFYGIVCVFPDGSNQILQPIEISIQE